MRSLSAEFLHAAGQSEPGAKESYDYFMMGVEYALRVALGVCRNTEVLLSIPPPETGPFSLMDIATDETREAISKAIEARFR